MPSTYSVNKYEVPLSGPIFCWPNAQARGVRTPAACKKRVSKKAFSADDRRSVFLIAQRESTPVMVLQYETAGAVIQTNNDTARLFLQQVA